MQKRERIVWIDQLRAVAFIFVILGHMSMDSTPKSWIYSFHMPLFFMISGLSLNIDKLYKTDFKKFFINQFQRTIIPYFWIQLVCLFSLCVLNAVTNRKAVPVGAYLKGIFVANGLIMPYPSAAMYFIIVLFLCQLCLWGIVRLSKKNYAVMTGMCVVFSSLSLITEGKAMPWRINIVPAAVLMIFTGRLLMNFYLEHKDKLQKLGAVAYTSIVLLLFALGAILWKYNGRLSMAGNKYGQSFPFALASAVFTSVAISLIVMKLPKMKLLTTVGQNTLFYMGFHRLFISLFERLFSQWKGTVPFIAVICLVVFFLLVPLVKYCEKFCPYFLGKPSGKDTPFILAGKVVSIAVCLFAPVFFVGNKFMDLTVSTNMIITAAVYIFAVAGCFLVFQKIPFIYIQHNKSV